MLGEAGWDFLAGFRLTLRSFFLAFSFLDAGRCAGVERVRFGVDGRVWGSAMTGVDEMGDVGAGVSEVCSAGSGSTQVMETPGKVSRRNGV